MNNLFLNLLNSISIPVITFIIGVFFMWVVRSLTFINGTKVATAISTIADNDALRALAKHLCIYAQKYVSEVAIEKLKYVITQIETYCKQCGLKITKEQVIEIAQSTYDENRSEISKIKFVKDLEKIIKDENNEELIAKIKTKKIGSN